MLKNNDRGVILYGVYYYTIYIYITNYVFVSAFDQDTAAAEPKYNVSLLRN